MLYKALPRMPFYKTMAVHYSSHINNLDVYVHNNLKVKI